MSIRSGSQSIILCSFNENGTAGGSGFSMDNAGRLVAEFVAAAAALDSARYNRGRGCAIAVNPGNRLQSFPLSAI
jgi:hypothetical protein